MSSCPSPSARRTWVALAGMVLLALAAARLATVAFGFPAPSFATIMGMIGFVPILPIPAFFRVVGPGRGHRWRIANDN